MQLSTQNLEFEEIIALYNEQKTYFSKSEASPDEKFWRDTQKILKPCRIKETSFHPRCKNTSQAPNTKAFELPMPSQG